jgi:hypothetical protein
MVIMWVPRDELAERRVSIGVTEARGSQSFTAKCGFPGLPSEGKQTGSRGKGTAAHVTPNAERSCESRSRFLSG